MAVQLGKGTAEAPVVQVENVVPAVETMWIVGHVGTSKLDFAGIYVVINHVAWKKGVADKIIIISVTGLTAIRGALMVTSLL